MTTKAMEKGGRTAVAALAALAVLGLVGCSTNPSPGPGTDAGPKTGSVQVDETATAAGAEDTSRSAARFNVPPGHLPPPGMCRVWVPGEPPDQRDRDHPVGRCSTLRLNVPEGAWLIYRPTDDPKHVRLWQYDGDGQVRAQRIYDIATGELIRHVAPASGG